MVIIIDGGVIVVGSLRLLPELSEYSRREGATNTAAFDSYVIGNFCHAGTNGVEVYISH